MIETAPSVYTVHMLEPRVNGSRPENYTPLADIIEAGIDSLGLSQTHELVEVDSQGWND